MPKTFTIPTIGQYKKTLAAKLNGQIVDPLRDLLTQFGLRVNDVQIVTIKWTGGFRGQGRDVVERTFRLLPAPRVRGLESMMETVDSVGLDEVGTITVDRISPRYTEEQLRGYETDGALPEDTEVFYEITGSYQDRAMRRRFHLSGAPHRGTLGWEISLVRAHEDRLRNGEVG